MHPMEIGEKREVWVMKERIFYLTNHIKFYSINNSIVTIFYFVTQSLALLSTFGDSPIFTDDSPTIQFINYLNSIFFFYSNSLYQDLDTTLVLSHLISLLLLCVFALIAFFAYSINHHNKIVVSKVDSKKIKMTELLVFLIISLNVPFSSFISYYSIQLIEKGLEILLLLPFLNLIFMLGLVFIVEECSIETNLKNYSSLSRLYNKNESIHSLVKMLVRMVVASFNNLSNNVIILSLLILLVFDLYELRITIFSKKYLNAATESIYGFKNICVVIMEILMIMCLFTAMPLIINNFFLATISTSILGYLSLQNFKQHKKRELTFEGLDAVMNEDDAKIFMLESIGLLDEKKNHEEVFTLGLITIHKENCTLESCFCQHYSETNNQKLVRQGIFLKKFVLNKLQKVVQKFPKSFLIISILFNYKLSMMSSFSKIYYLLKHYIQQNEQNLSSFSQHYMLYQMEVIIEQQIHKNLITTQVEVEKIFIEDTLNIELTKLLTKINDKFLEKYRLLSQQICNLNLIENICEEVTVCIRSVQRLWANFSEQDSFNLKIYEIFLIYFEYIVFCRKQVNEVKSIILTKTQALRHLKGINEQNLQRYLYTNKACVIETVSSKEKIGLITNVSSSCSDIFQLKKDQMINKDIHELMPDYLALPHKKWSREWLDNETLTGKLLGILNTHYVDISNNCFTASMHMKIASVGFRLKFYMMVIKENPNDYLLLDENLEIQGYGYRLQNEQIMDRTSLKKPISDYCQFNIQKELKDTDIIKRRIVFSNETNLNHSQRDIAFALLQASSQVKMDKIPQVFIHQCEVIIEKHLTSNKFLYYTLRFLQIKKLTKQTTNQYYFKTIADTMSNLNDPTNKKVYKNEYFQMAGDSKQMERSSNTNRDTDEEEKNRFEINNMSSIAESSVGQGNVVFSKLIEELKEKTIKQNVLYDKNTRLVTFIIAGLQIGVIFFTILQPYLFEAGMTSYSNIISSNSKVSQNSMFLELDYNRLLMTNIYCYDDQTYDKKRCEYILNSSKILSSNYYQQAVTSMNSYLTDRTFLSNLQSYAAYEMKVELKMGDSIMQASVREFMQYYYYSLEQIRYQTAPNTFRKIARVNESFDYIYTNWPKMRRINSEAIDFYKQAGKKQLQMLQLLTYALSGLFLVSLLVLLASSKIYYHYIERKSEQIYKLYGYLNHSTCNFLKVMGENIRYCLKHSYSEIKSDMDGHGLRQSKQKSQTKYEKNKKFNYFLILFLILLSSLNLIIILNFNALFQPASQILNTVSSLIQSENQAFESYLELKAYKLSEKSFSPSTEILLKNLIGKINESQIAFSRYAKQSINIFSDLSPNFEKNFNDLLVGDICKQTLSFFSIKWQQQKCQNGMHFRIINQGIVASMTFLQRNTLKSAIKLQKCNKTELSVQLKSVLYEDMDDYLFYMMRVCQLIQEKLVSGLRDISYQTIVYVNIIMGIEIAVLLAMMLIWICRLDGEKKKISNLYGAVLQLPQILFKQNKVIMRILKENLALKS